MHGDFDPIRGRGAAENPANRFAALSYARDPHGVDLETSTVQTQFLPDPTRSIITHNTSPDVGFDVSINPYRGCEHGCSYCYARPTHEYLGFSAGLDFETRILVKHEAPALVRQALSSPRWTPQVIAMSGVTDPYQPVERDLRLTRGCLEVLTEYRNPVAIITKNYLVTRDIDLLADLARYQAASVMLSMTTLNSDLSRVMEPRASSPTRRLAAIERLAEAGVLVGVMVAPVISGLNDHELPMIINAAAGVGAQFASYGLLRLPLGVAPLFEQWLGQHAPTKKTKVLRRLRGMHDGKLNDGRFGHRMRGEGIFAEQIGALFKLACRRTGLLSQRPSLSTTAFRRPGETQLTLFD